MRTPGYVALAPTPLTTLLLQGPSATTAASPQAGAGFTGRSTDACRKNDGWQPDGHYRPRLCANYVRR